ncbi:MAG: hypothetical protein HC923_10570 [Myxococcales bacterium]|nr:hypothetical protein [Myxococcales bacterium]
MVEQHPEHTAATTDYMLPFSAALQYQNYHAVQFHPEKSGKLGLQLLRNFVEYVGRSAQAPMNEAARAT